MVRLRAVLALSMVSVGPSFGVSEPELDPNALNPSERCGACHSEIYAMWKQSLHRGALQDPVFQAAYMQAYRETAGQARGLCLRCHAPVAFVNGDLDLREPSSWEGITCDFCHSIAAVDLQRREQPFRIAMDGVKRGPIANTNSPAHDVEQSTLHESSEFCAGCHEYVNEHGLSVLSTYTEWKTSPQAVEGKTCQHCHMPLTPGGTVVPEFNIQGRRTINLHNISGGHSREQVQKAATVRIIGVERRSPDVVWIDIEVANVGSGHSIPTGMPTRKLILEVMLFAKGRLVHRFERSFQRVLLDVTGKPITEDHRALLGARKVREDTRLRPGERRRERFVGGVPEEGRLRVEATLTYSYEPRILMREKMSIKVASDEFTSMQ